MVMVINVDFFPGNVVPLASVLGFFIIRTESNKGIPVSTRIVVDVLNLKLLKNALNKFIYTNQNIRAS